MALKRHLFSPVARECHGFAAALMNPLRARRWQLRKASARVIRLLGLDANMPVRSFTACCQTVTAACGEFVPRGEQ